MRNVRLAQPDLVPLSLQVGDCGADFADGAVADAASAVEHPVDGRLGQARLDGDLADPEWMGGHEGHSASDGFLTGFRG